VLSVPQTYLGPKKTTDPNEVTTVSVTTVSDAAYQPLDIDLTGVTGISMAVTPHNTSVGALIAVYDKNNPDQTIAYEFNPLKSQMTFAAGKAIGKIYCQNSNVYGYVPVPFGTFKSFWLSWENGRIAAGEGETTGVNTILSCDDPTPLVVNSIKIMSKGINANWKIPSHLYGSK